MSDPLSHAWLVHCVVLFFLTIFHEGTAIVAATFAHVHFGLPTGLAFLSVYLGTIAGDLTIYGLGRFARYSPRLRARFIGPRVEHAKVWLESHLIRMIVLCRVTPGLLFPTFLACGWFRLPIPRFALLSVLSVSIYTPLAMALVSLLGQSLMQHFGQWVWAVIFMLALFFGVSGVWRRP
ncbi:VTT domain-containing protein [uncultured Thiodictyon sp.]|uniref:DedA family protein n=1 Tax=uncultured Thiodictyon sp. TaxID=1846217 RepID=UPI0025D40A80|nr:VTT domain-containing protein [uncultured Thiodictyon sp.]